MAGFLVFLFMVSYGPLWWLLRGAKKSQVKRGIAAALLAWVVIGYWLLIHDSDNHFALWLYDNRERRKATGCPY
jgi:hypothetical protein